jgi:hypothetical protein
LGVFLVLGAMAVPLVSDAQRERAYARTPVIDESQATGLKMTVIRDAIQGRQLMRVATADVQPTGPLPPGVSALPRPGEVVVSPALRALIGSDPAVGYRFPQRITGEVGRQGLVAPDELLAYVGVDARELTVSPGVVTAFQDASNGKYLGSMGTTEIERLLTPSRVVSAAFGLFLAVPLSVLLAICVRFDASRRDRRLAALRLVGASRRQAHMSAAVEMTLIATVGVLAGLGLFKAIAPLTEGWRIGRFHWYASDLVIPSVRIAAFAVLVVVLAVVVSAGGSRSAVKSPIRIRRLGSVAPSFLRLIPLVVAPLALLAAPLTWLRPQYRLFLLGIGIIASVVALTLVIPLVLHGAGVLVAKLRQLPVWATLAARRAAHSPAITPKLVTTVLVAIFIAGFGMMIGTTLKEDRPLPTEVNDEGRTVVTAEAFGVPRIVVEKLRSVPSAMGLALMQRSVAQSAEPASGSGSPDSVILVWASCRDLAQLFEHVEHCADGRTYRVTHDGAGGGSANDLKPGSELVIKSLYREGERLRIPAEALSVRGEDKGCYCDLVSTVTPDTGDLVLTLAGGAHDFWRDAARLAPGIDFQGPLNRDRGFDTFAMLTLISVGLTLTIGLGLLAFAIASVDRGVEARHKDAPLLAIGVPVRVLRLAEAAQLLVVVVSGILLGLVLLALTTHSWAGVFGMSFGAVVEPLVPLFGSVVTGTVLLMLAVLALTTRGRTLAPEDLRRE